MNQRKTRMQLFLADCQFPDIDNQIKFINFLSRLGKTVKWQNQINQTNLRCYLEFMHLEKESSMFM